ncbi:MAG: response regulator [Hyphomonadaceae bacterium]
MTSPNINELARVNLSKAVVLVIETTPHAAEMLGQILKGFGVAETHRVTSVKDAEKLIKTKSFDLILVDPDVKDGDGYTFLRGLRASGVEPNCYVPIVLMSGHARISNVKRARDTGANFFVSKPIAPNVLLQRILWIARDKRPFVDAGAYIGPDRRFKYEGPPANSDGRRANDLKEPLGDAGEPNMSQIEIDDLIKPQKVLV